MCGANYCIIGVVPFMSSVIQVGVLNLPLLDGINTAFIKHQSSLPPPIYTNHPPHLPWSPDAHLRAPFRRRKGEILKPTLGAASATMVLNYSALPIRSVGTMAGPGPGEGLSVTMRQIKNIKGVGARVFSRLSVRRNLAEAPPDLRHGAGVRGSRGGCYVCRHSVSRFGSLAAPVLVSSTKTRDAGN